MYNYRLRRNILLLSAALLLAITACQSSDQKLQRYLDAAQTRIEAGNFKVARIELLNAIKIDPSSSKAYFLLGRALMGMKDYGGAARALANANELAPEDRVITLEYAQLLTAGKAYEIAEPIISKWVAESPDDQDFLVLLSLIQARSGRRAEALDTAQQVLKLSPDSAKAWLHLSQVNLIIGERAGAEQALGEAEKLDPISVDAGLMRVTLFQEQGQFEDAADRLELLIRENPGRNDLKFRLARLYEGIGRKDDAIRTYRGISEKEPNPPALYRLGLMLYSSGQKDEAVQLWRSSIETNPYLLGPRLSLVRHYWSEKNIPEAMDAINEALKFAPEDSEALALRGELNMAEGKAGEALSDFQKALDSRPDSVPLRLSLAQAQLGAGELTPASQNLRTIVEKYPDHAHANLLLAKFEANAGNLEESSQYARAVSDDKTVGREAMWILGDNALKQGDVSRAKKNYERNLSLHGAHPGTRFRLARSMELLGENKEAEKNYRILLDERPNDILPLAHLVSLLGRTGREEDALALARENANAGVPHQLLLGRVLEGTGNIEEARDLYLALTQSQPDLMAPYQRVVALYARGSDLQGAENWLTTSINGSDAPQPRLLVLLGMVQDVLGKKVEAISTYWDVLRSEPDFVPAINNLAWNLAESGDLSEALKLAAKGRKLAPEDPSMGDTYAWILHRSGDSAGALPVLRQALKALPDNKTVRLHLVEVLKAVGRDEEAEQVQKGDVL